MSRSVLQHESSKPKSNPKSVMKRLTWIFCRSSCDLSRRQKWSFVFFVDTEKTVDDWEQEKELLKKLLEIVNEKARLVDEQDEQQQRQSAETEGEQIVQDKIQRKFPTIIYSVHSHSSFRHTSSRMANLRGEGGSPNCMYDCKDIYEKDHHWLMNACVEEIAENIIHFLSVTYTVYRPKSRRKRSISDVRSGKDKEKEA